MRNNGHPFPSSLSLGISQIHYGLANCNELRDLHKRVSQGYLNNILLCFRVVWKSLLVLYAKDVLTDLVTIHHGQPRWQYCTQVSSTLFGEAIARLFLASMSSISRANIDKEVSIFQSFSSEILHCIS